MSTKPHLLGAAAVFAVGLAFQASAAPIFQVNPDVVGSTASAFSADEFAGSSSTLVELDLLTNTGFGSGWIQFTAFSIAGNPVLGTGINNDYQFWSVFTYGLETQDPGDTIGPGVDLFLTSLEFTLFAAPGTAVTFAPTALTDFVTPTVDTTGAATVHTIGSGSLITGVLEPTSQGGNAFNSQVTYANTAFGNTFFFDPSPFYNVIFNQFNNTEPQVQTSGNNVRIAATGSNVFALQEIPEPTTLALMGLGLLGLGAATRRRKA